MCKISAQQIAADGKAVGDAVLQIAKLVQLTDPALAAQLTAAANALIDATANWQSGSTIALIIDAENAVIAVLNLVPPAAPYAAFVAIAFAALNLLLANTTSQPKLTANYIHDTKLVITAAEAANASSPWYGKAVIVHHFRHSPAQDFEQAWNDQVALAPTLGMVAIHV